MTGWQLVALLGGIGVGGTVIAFWAIYAILMGRGR